MSLDTFAISLLYILLGLEKLELKVAAHCLFIFKKMTLKKGVQLLTPDLVANALSDGAIHFALYGNLLNH